MFDIDAYLDTIAVKEVSPSDTLINKTVEQCGEVMKTKEKERKTAKQIKKVVMIAVPAAALLLIGIFIGSQLNVLQGTAVNAASACFTVDINPSVCVNVDEESIVTSLVGQNKDAADLVEKLDCIGEPAADAIYEIVDEAKALGYINEENKYVLIGCFGISDEDATIGSLQEKLENSFGDMIDLLTVSGTLEEKTQADTLDVSAGLLKLSRMAQGVDIDNEDKVEDVVGELKNTYSAPTLSVNETKDGLVLKWTKLDFVAMGYSGEVTYEIAAADTAADVKNLTASVLKRYTFQTGDTQNTSYKLTPDSGILSGTKKYYGIYVKYANVAKLVGNVVSAVMPEVAAPKASASPAVSPSPTQTPQPEQEPTVTGRVSGDAVVIKWRQDTSESLSGYKIVASKTNPNPRYPDDGYIKYITNKDTTSIKLYEGVGGLKAGKTYYFSVTYLYENGSTVAANAVQLKVPSKAKTPSETAAPPAEPTTAPTQAAPPSGDYASTSISGSMDGNTARLSWGQIDDARFDGYKVVCSFSNSSPSYPGDGYVKWITDASKTSCSVDMTKISGYAPGAVCYFAITALYDGHSVKKTGNTVSLTMPAAPAAPESQPYESTGISGSMDGSTARLSWGQINDERFDGYKVVCSFSNSSPSYPNDGYERWITDASKTSCSLDMTGISGYTPGATCYFAITVLYDGHDVKKTGNTISLPMP